MRKLIVIFVLGLLVLPAFSMKAMTRDTLNLSGLWRFQLDPMGFGKTPGSELYLHKLSETICLPGSTDQAGKGIKNTAHYVDRLSRKYEYCGPAWYQREVVIPEDWEGQNIQLKLERCHWETTVYVDGEPAGRDERLSTPNRFVLSNLLTPGTHTITICVDNRLKYPMDQWTHGTTEYTQTNWNGIVGDIILTSSPASGMESIQIYPDVDGGNANVTVKMRGKSDSGKLRFSVKGPDGKIVTRAERKLSMPADSLGVNVEIPLGKEIRLWDEFNPDLYTLTTVLVNKNGDETETLTERFGMRKVEQGTHHIKINGIDRHLRGVLDCCVFPLTGYPSTDPSDWRRIFSTIREYGFNHVRFHSWCPPEAAFSAADELGFYLQVELPMWIKDVGRYPDRRDFFEKEMYAILDEYGNHPSFVLYCNGNENEGDFSILEDLIVRGQNYDPRHLYSASTARTHVKADQFYTSHVTSNGWITVYEGKPSTDWDLNKESAIDVPVIAHETGQRCMYPNFKEMSKYTGVLEPRNMNVFRERLARNGMLDQADDFFKATGAHTVLQYKEVNEALLRTQTSGGYQLLGLQDFPGQGSAYVGILDPFWETKNLVTPEEYRESNGDVVVLAKFPKRVYDSTESFPVKLGVYNFGKLDIGKGHACWSLVDAAGNEVKKGSIRHEKIERSTVDSIGFVEIPLSGLETPGKYTFHVDLAYGHHNKWDIWVYPQNDRIDTASLLVTTSWEEAKHRLQNAETVLFVPETVNGRHTHFAGHFWNPIMFNWDPMIVGTLIDKDNGAFASFPTDVYADWQWTDILNNAVAVDLTEITELTPVIQSIDTYENNRKLGIAFEAKTPEGGNLFVLCVDPVKNIDQRPATRRLFNSVKEYVASDRFVPKTEIPLYRLDAVFDTANYSKQSAKAADAINQLLNQ